LYRLLLKKSAAEENKLLQCDIAGSVAHDVASWALNINDGSKPDTRTVSSFHQTNQTSLIHTDNLNK